MDCNFELWDPELRLKRLNRIIEEYNLICKKACEVTCEYASLKGYEKPFSNICTLVWDSDNSFINSFVYDNPPTEDCRPSVSLPTCLLLLEGEELTEALKIIIKNESANLYND